MVNEKVLELAKALCALESGMSAVRTDEVREEPRPGESDVDLFVFCDVIPSKEKRQRAYESLSGMGVVLRQMQVCENCVWGTGDLLTIDGVDVMPMYFTKTETDAYAREIAEGKHLYCEGGFYPVGRLMTFCQMIPLAGDGYALELKARWREYPEALRRAMLSAHMNNLYEDEDFARARLRRDPVYFHQVLENALDHALLTLYALNRVYFPSRKRTAQYVAAFAIKPANCYARILGALEASVRPETLPGAVDEWRRLAEEITALARAALNNAC